MAEANEAPKVNIFGQDMKTIDPNQEKKCYFCNTPMPDEIDPDTGEAASLVCYGCGKYVCQDCDHFEGLGNHDVEDHRGSDEQDCQLKPIRSPVRRDNVIHQKGSHRQRF